VDLLLNGFYGHFEDELKDAGAKMEDIKRMEKKTDEKCDLCGSPLLLKWGKFGSFYACSAYNKKDKSSCTFTKENTAAKPDMNTPEAQEAGEQEEYCDNCGRVMVLRRGPFGMFMSCPGLQRGSALQDLPQAEQQAAAESGRAQPTGEDCPQCGKPLVLRQGVMESLSPAPAIPSAST
jgi:DNA topoisomerase-1